MEHAPEVGLTKMAHVCQILYREVPSTVQPSNIEKCNVPFILADIPDVPDASNGRNGLNRKFEIEMIKKYDSKKFHKKRKHQPPYRKLIVEPFLL